MRIGKVIGTVTLSHSHPSMAGASYRLVAPMTFEDLLHDNEPKSEALVVYDDLGAGVGCRIAFSEGGEAAQPFEPKMKPVDAYCAAILDAIDVRKP
jgi:microcompartment protein CcmK/EutM